MSGRTLYFVVCGAPLAGRVGAGVRAARERGWVPYVMPTDAGLEWLQGQDLGGAPVVVGRRRPGEAKRSPEADAVLVVPATFNTLNAWALGLANTYPLTILCTALGARTPTVAVPSTNRDLAGHPAWGTSLALLRDAGVRIVDPADGSTSTLTPITPGEGDRIAGAFHWKWALDPLD